jgi:hypothetical protein
MSAHAKGSGPADRRIRRELKTLRLMIGMYCRGKHGGGRELCAGCAELWEYASRRVGRCPHGARKPACADCETHCFAPGPRERVREVMRYAGPRMAWRHPVLALFHLLR